MIGALVLLTSLSQATPTTIPEMWNEWCARWEAALPLSRRATGGTPRRGIGDIELAFKYVLGADATRTRIASAGVEVALPTGSEVRELGSGTAVFEPYLAAGVMGRRRIPAGANESGVAGR